METRTSDRDVETTDEDHMVVEWHVSSAGPTHLFQLICDYFWTSYVHATVICPQNPDLALMNVLNTLEHFSLCPACGKVLAACAGFMKSFAPSQSTS
jgi:hypothetical protein